ncbi:hypothetical protein LV478_05990 [Komagataeibacter oboediens]|uniref:Uncharacterized protein n=1 Tax=Komagataeibacter oboediens TaxID=65958 RepID=A0A318QT97_9PROT|nr:MULTISPECIES: hypothetical protein [Komagataeibacter]MBV0889924.1 hypothetical protein [Komagataeibacter oboediens]MCK9820088.1 hypothetical protein [Komagataeibacter oboediens]PYD80601.1 hypothetical protein CFR80_13340 [Komagataeibacter oboediens]WEQ53073.1 hypothetical protein LV478_05990 [Komagataeibacter oboediens]
MGKVVTFRTTARRDESWAVVAFTGRGTRIASIYPTRAAAEADCEWRNRQVAAYRNFLERNEIAIPRHTIRPYRRADLPRAWRPLPALGFLHGQC